MRVVQATRRPAAATRPAHGARSRPATGLRALAPDTIGAVLGIGSRYVNPRTGGALEVLEMTPELLRFERLYKPRTGRADPHLHLDFTHSWEVIAGRGRFEVDGEERDLGPGESGEVQLERPHRDLFNPFEEEALARFEIRPCNEFVETFFETLVWLFERG